MNRLIISEPELFAEDGDIRQYDTYERPDGTRFRVERPRNATG